MTTQEMTTWGPEWHCTECGRPSREYTDHTLCYYCATGEEPMNSVITFEFYSDTNLVNSIKVKLEDFLGDTTDIKPTKQK